MIESSSAVFSPMTPILFPQPFRPPPPSIESITYNYMTTEELKEFMLNEQKVYRKDFLQFRSNDYLFISKIYHW